MDMIINLKPSNTMTHTIEVKHKVPTTVHISEVSLPLYLKTGKYSQHYCVMQSDGNLIEVHWQGGYWHIQVTPHDDADEIADRLEREFCDPQYMPIDEAVFMHKCSEAHREVFYMVNPDLRPKL